MTNETELAVARAFEKPQEEFDPELAKKQKEYLEEYNHPEQKSHGNIRDYKEFAKATEGLDADQIRENPETKKALD